MVRHFKSLWFVEALKYLTFIVFPAETLSEVGRQVLAKHEDLISLKVVFLPQVRTLRCDVHFNALCEPTLFIIFGIRLDS